MPEYLSPGVYIEELNTGPVPIEGVSTSTAGFVGQTERGPTEITFVTSFTEYQRWFGSFIDPSISYLPFAVKGFFDNGGQRLFIARVSGAGSAKSSLQIPGSGLTATAIGEGAWGERIFLRVQGSTLKRGNPPASVGFRLTILYFSSMPPVNPPIDPFDRDHLRDKDRREPDVVEDFDNLLIDPKSSDYVLTAVNGSSQLISLSADGTVSLPGDLAWTQMTGGTDVAAAATDYVAQLTADKPPNERRGLQALDTIDEISLVCIPDEAKPGFDLVTTEIMTQCDRRKDRFAILQVLQGQGQVEGIVPPEDSSYGAIYSPWIRVYNDITGDNLLIPPGGHIAGIYARTDVERGVHKAPANCEIAGMVTRDIDSTRKALEYAFTKGEQDILNPRGVNVIRDFRSHMRGIRVWGARTMSSDSQWKYINVRRLFIFVEQSVERGTQWVVFEPNTEPTWERVRRSISNFLRSVWLSGALEGTKAEEAFFVKCDRTTMTQDDIDNGRLICIVGIAPAKPAEFVIFRFMQKTIETQQ